MNLENWSEKDLEDLDAKFDALTEYLGVAFVFERVSDGSDRADSERVYIRPKNQVRNREIPDYDKPPLHFDFSESMMKPLKKAGKKKQS